MGIKLVSVEDYVQITNLMGAYQHLVDEGDGEGWADLFTEDGGFYGVPGAPPDAFRGREGLKQIPAATRERGARHLTGSLSVRYGDSKDEAFARYYAVLFAFEDGPGVDMFVIVDTHLVRVGDEWKIRSNTMKPLGAGAAAGGG